MYQRLQTFLCERGLIDQPHGDKKTHWKPGPIVRSIHGALGLAALAAIITLGPIDTVRVAYNASIGDTVPLKRELLNYTITNLKKKQPNITTATLETTLQGELDMPDYQFSVTSATELRMERLFDATEKYAPNAFEQYFWPILR